MHTARMSAISVVRRHGVGGARPCATRRRGPRSSLTAAALAVGLASLVLTPPAAGAADRPGAPGNIGASWNTTTPTSLDVTWTSPGGSYLEYQVMYRTDAGTVWDPDPAPVSVGWKSAAGTVTTPSRTVAGLDASATYVIAVRARSRVTGLYGVWGISGLIEPSGTPGRPSGITESARSATSLTVEWPKVADAAGGYDLRIAEHGSSPAWSTATTVKASQPGSGTTASKAVASANLPSGYAVSKTYLAQVRSRSSASGTCGSGGVKCSRWVTSGQLAQLDISGLTAVKNRNGGDPSHVREDRLDVDVTWDALPSSLSNVSYELRFRWRNGQPSRFYDGSTGRPSGWVQDWQWWTLCNDGDAANNPSAAQDTGDVDGDNDTTECLDPYHRTPPYLEPMWSFGPPEWGSVVTVADSANCSGSGDARTCSYTFADATVSYLTDKVQIRAVVGAGQSAQYGPRTYFTTSPVRAPGRPYGLSVAAPTGSSVKATWSVPYDNGSAITGYDLELVDVATGRASTTVTGTKGTPAPPIPGDGSTRLSYTFSGVTSNKTYTVSVRAVNAKGRGNWRRSGNIALTPTAPGAPLLSAAPGGKGSGKLTLTAELENTGGSAVTSWKRRLKTGNTYGAWTTIPSASGSSLSAVVSNLTNGTSYTYQVQACNSAGCGTESNDATSTPVNVPSAVTSPTAGSGRNGYVFLGGTATDNGSPITHWEYQYKQTSSAGAYSAWSSDWTVDHTSSPGSLDARVGGLTNGTGYSFRIRAVNIGGPGPQSTVLTATPAERTKPKVNLTLTPSSVSEGNTATVTAAFPWGFTSTHATTVTVAVAPTSPATASDYTLSSNVTLTIPAYTEAGTGTVTIAAVDDSLDENGEILAVSATVSNSSTQGVTAPDSQTLTITDDDTAAIVLSKTSVGITEGATASYTVKLGSQPTHDVTVTLTLSTNQTQNTSLSASTLTFTTSNWSTAQTVTLTSAEDNDGTSGTFRISHAASGSDTTYSALSAATVQVIVTDNDVPTAPAAPAWDPGGTTVTLSWAAPSHIGGTGATIAGYEVRYKVSNTFGAWTTVTPSPATSTTVTVTPTSATQTYDYQVRAKNNSNHWSPWSEVTAAVAQAVDVPDSLSLTPGNQQLTVTWSAPSNLNGLSIQLYVVSWQCGSGSASLQAATTTTSTITGLTNGVPCDVWVYALGTDGSNSSSSPLTARKTATPTAGS